MQGWHYGKGLIYLRPIFRLPLRLRRICSTDEFFKHRSAELQAYLTKRGYKRRFIQDQISRAKQIPRNEALKEQKQASKDTSDRVPFTCTYNPALPMQHSRYTPQETTYSTLHRTFKKHLQRSSCRRLPPFTQPSRPTRSR